MFNMEKRYRNKIIIIMAVSFAIVHPLSRDKFVGVVSSQAIPVLKVSLALGRTL